METNRPSLGGRSLFRKKRRRITPMVAVVVAVGLLAGAGYWFVAVRADQEDGEDRDKLVRACEIDPEILERVWRGYVPKRSGDVLAIERHPNQFNTRHSTPFPYTQDVPLVLYGPGHIDPGQSERDVTVADLAPTYAELLDFDFETRDGEALEEALTGSGKPPKLIFTLVWDGGGDNVLEKWPDAWPNLRRLMERGFSYRNATVGSSPSITPSIHATIGTGAFPRAHGLSDTLMRVRGKMVDAWEGKSPRFLRERTLADEWDLANDNQPIVGMFARDTWHLGMIGHGSYIEGADRDIAVMDDFGEVEFRDPGEYYSMPGYVLGNEGLEEAIAEVDARDGEADNRWLGNPLFAIDGRIRETPAWSIYQTGVLKELVTNEGFGADDVTDLLYVNYKSTDLVGHSYNMVEPEEESALQEQDRQLAEIVRFLDRQIGKRNYVLALTADHGMTPYPSVTGGWNIVMREMEDDIEKRFGSDDLVFANRGYAVFLDKKQARKTGTSPEDLARFLRNYTIADNAASKGDIPEEFEQRTDEKVFLTALTPDALKAALDCARER